MSLLMLRLFAFFQYAIKLVDKLHHLFRVHFITGLFGEVSPIIWLRGHGKPTLLYFLFSHATLDSKSRLSNSAHPVPPTKSPTDLDGKFSDKEKRVTKKMRPYVQALRTRLQNVRSRRAYLARRGLHRPGRSSSGRMCALRMRVQQIL
jgi:hypothetical protein